VGQIIPTCKSALVLTLLAIPSLAAAKTEDVLGQYANARLAEIGLRDDIALKGYLKLYRDAPDSEILADRLFGSAVRSGDMATAVRTARAQTLRNGGSAETSLLLFADAYRARNWAMADVAADELAHGGNFAFMSLILKSWVRVAQGKSPDFAEANPADDPFFAYYSSDQRIYLEMASGQLGKAKFALRALAGQQGDFVRDIMITGAGVMAAHGDDALASALMRFAVNAESETTKVTFDKKNGSKLSPNVGISALYARLATSLLEQNVDEQALLLARIGNWIAPDSVGSQIVLARALRANGLPDSAMLTLARVTAASPYWIVVLRQKIDWLVADGSLAQAASIVSDAQKRSPNSVAVKLMLAQVQQEGGKLTQAIEAYRALSDAAEAAKSLPRQQAHYDMLLASALDQSGNWPAARVELEKILIIDPNNGQVLNYLGYSLLERGIDKERATAMVKRAYDMNPSSSAVTDSLGWAYYQQGDLGRAVPLLEKAAKAEAGDVAINEHLGDAYWTAGRRREARYAWLAAVPNAEGDAATRIAAKIDFGLPLAANTR
jgi:tetratricopeptide (TPR) repeat protein